MLNKKKLNFFILYIFLLTIFTTYVLLDAFIIPKSYKIANISMQNHTSTNNYINYNNTIKNSNYSKAIITSNSYKDDKIHINIEKETIYNTDVYIADITIVDANLLKTAFADNTYGKNIKEKTSTIAENINAIFAVNGDYYSFRRKGFVIRNGTLYRDTSNDGEDLAIYSDGSFDIIDESNINAQDLIDNGVMQILSFGPALIKSNEICVSENTEVDMAKSSNPRTAIGIIDNLHYIIIVSDGRTNESKGLSLYELAQIMQNKGCSIAYNLDGGGSSTMWFNGQVINNPTDGNKYGERKVSDIVYIGY